MAKDRPDDQADIFTDGSCHTKLRVGGWAAVIFWADTKTLLCESQKDTTHNRMELTAVIRSLEHLRVNQPQIRRVTIYSDSQYVTGLPSRRQKLSAGNFYSKNAEQIPNADLLGTLFTLIDLWEITWVKVRAHQKRTNQANFNIEADKSSRKAMRDALR